MINSGLPHYFVTDTDVLAAYAEDASGEVLMPQFVVRPSSTEEVVECLRYCNSERISVTPSGKRTGYSAGAITNNGVCLSTERLRRVVEVNSDKRYAVVEPGVLLGEFKRELAAKNLLYAPDPNSEDTASIGGTVATNAAGPRSYKYGTTLKHILGLEVALADGTLHFVLNPLTDKSTTGPCALTNLGDLWVGSEGIFGVITKIKVRLIPGVPEAFAIVAFFESIEHLLQMIIDLRDSKYPAVSPRALELLDQSCLNLIRRSGKFPQVTSKGTAALIIEQEYDETGSEQYLSQWFAVLERAKALVNECIVADSDSKIVELRSLRHYIPSTLNEHGYAARKSGGRKISTDWSIGVYQAPEMFKQAEVLCREHGFPPERTFRFAHIGNGHPHFNFIAKDRAEYERCVQLREKLSELAVSLGGTVAAEHGIGKLRKKLLEYEKPELKLRLMRALKREIDPNGIMAPGNIL